MAPNLEKVESNINHSVQLSESGILKVKEIYSYLPHMILNF